MGDLVHQRWHRGFHALLDVVEKWPTKMLVRVRESLAMYVLIGWSQKVGHVSVHESNEWVPLHTFIFWSRESVLLILTKPRAEVTLVDVRREFVGLVVRQMDDLDEFRTFPEALRVLLSLSK